MSSIQLIQQAICYMGMTANEISTDDKDPAETWNKLFKDFAPQTGYMQTDDTDYEIYFENGESGLFCEPWIPVIPLG